MVADHGRDLSCTVESVTLEDPDAVTRTEIQFDATEDFDTVSGRVALAQALARRLTTPRGDLVDPWDEEGAANYGIDVTEHVNDDMGPGDLAQLEQRADAECRKDERVHSAASTATLVDEVLTLSIALQDAEGPFTLTLTVDAFGAKQAVIS